MSYVSGFMMGAAIGKSIRQMVAGGGAPKMGGTAAMQQAAPAAELPVAELQRQKEELEDLIAAQEAKKAK